MVDDSEFALYKADLRVYEVRIQAYLPLPIERYWEVFESHGPMDRVQALASLIDEGITPQKAAERLVSSFSPEEGKVYPRWEPEPEPCPNAACCIDCARHCGCEECRDTWPDIDFDEDEE